MELTMLTELENGKFFARLEYISSLYYKLRG